MDKTELYVKVNEKRRQLGIKPMTREEFVEAISTLEATGYMTTDGNECYAIRKYTTEVTL